MKYLLYLPMFVFGSMLMAQGNPSPEPGEKILVNNELVKVIEHVSSPEGEVCGEGMHHHEPHLTVVLDDAKVLITSEEGESQEVEVKSGTTLWFESETHSVVNIGEDPARMLLVYLK